MSCKITGEPNCKCEYDMPSISKPTIKETLRKLFTDHANYTHLYIINEIYQLKTLKSITERLLQNQEDIGLAFEPTIGEEVAHDLSELLKKHILCASAVVKSAIDVSYDKKYKPEFDENVRLLFENSSDVSYLISELGDFTYEEIRTHFDEHNQYVIDITSLYISQKYGDIPLKYDCYYTHMLGFSDMLSLLT